MHRSIDTLANLIEKSKTCEEEDLEPNELLYHFVSAGRPPYEIAGYKDEAICLLINFSIKRENVENPLDLEEARQHLEENNNQLIKRFLASIRGWHTHNVKFPLSFLRGNIRYVLPYDDSDPYVHSGSVKLRKRFGYSQNAAYIKASKALLGEFVYHGKLTSMLEEIQQASPLAERFMKLLYEAEESTGCRQQQGEESEKESTVDNLYKSILSLPVEEFPDSAKVPQIFAFTDEGEPNLLLSPVAHTGMMYEINLRLREYEPWLGTWMVTGTGNDRNTYGDLVSDTGGWLKVLRSVPPVERKGKFGKLANQLCSAGHLYSFKRITIFFTKFSTAYIDEETGEQKRRTSYRQNQVLENQAEKIAESIFGLYQKLNFYLSIGRIIPKRCQHVIDNSEAQNHLIKKGVKTSKAIKVVLEELMPLLVHHINSLIPEDELPFTEHQQEVIRNAIIGYFRQN